MNEIYVCVIEEHNNGVRVKLFWTAEEAVSFAENYVEENEQSEYDFEHDYGEVELFGDMIYFRRFSSEGDDIWVERQTLPKLPS